MESKQTRSLQSIRKIENGLSISSYVQKDEVKPSPTMFEALHRHFQGDGQAFFAIGDSIEKDLFPCSKLGISTIWAQYGRVTDSKNQETLDSITPWSSAEFKSHYSESDFKPDFAIADFRSLYDILPLPKELF